MEDRYKIQNAIVNIRVMVESSPYYRKDRVDDDLKLIEEIVDKAIPKKPSNLYSGPMMTEWKCPTCGEKHIVNRIDGEYCTKCGQRILWEAK